MRLLLLALALSITPPAMAAYCRLGDGKLRPLTGPGVNMKMCSSYIGASFPFECSVYNKGFVYCSVADCDQAYRRDRKFSALEAQSIRTGIFVKFTCER